MSCTRIDELLPPYLDGDLSAADRAEVDRHLAACEKCRRSLAEYERLERSLFALRRTVPSWKTAETRLDERLGFGRRKAFTRIFLSAPAVAGLATAALGFVLISRAERLAAAFERFGSLLAGRSQIIASASGGIVESLSRLDILVLSSIYALLTFAILLANARFVLRWGRR